MAITPQKVEELAAGLAREIHAGQMYDKVGYFDGAGVWHEPRPYFAGHIIPAVRVVQALGYGHLYVATTYLHDGVEQGRQPNGRKVTGTFLVQRCMPGEVVFGVDCLTKRPGEPLDEYRERVLLSPLAVVAKFADSGVNLGNTLLRQPEVPDEVFGERVETYLGNMALFSAHMPPPDMGAMELPDRLAAG
jgi:hypothetical protein